jgi:ribosomal-protein-alanine N-acetyltransferase
MTIDDIPAVVEIEQASLNGNWPATAFERELDQNAMARYLVLELQSGERPQILGFAGLWLMVDEAHVVTVAVAPEHRRRGYGRLLVHALLGLATRNSMAVATLECRVSNLAARRLYRDYGFYEVGKRTRYYSDNGEDAVIMTTEALDSLPFQERLARLQELLPTVDLSVTKLLAGGGPPPP